VLLRVAQETSGTSSSVHLHAPHCFRAGLLNDLTKAGEVEIKELIIDWNVDNSLDERGA
jgi:hypothetical protein